MRIVHSLEELLELPLDRTVNGFRRREALQLEIPSLTRQALTSAQCALNDLQSRGGSIVGIGFLFVAMVYGLVDLFQRHEALLSRRTFGELAFVLIVSAGVGCVAKYAVLAVTRWQFAYRCRAHHHLLSMLLGPAHR
jgi:hypothetical protein